MREWLKENRNSHNLTQEDVSNKCGISRSFYTNIENGTKTPSVEVAKRIAKELGFNWTSFFEDERYSKEQFKIHSA